ncbi:MAG: hypothetical protein HAW67_06895 [Endozoicomonadaceae bacterium]|nr:hypothetical protein [Endozoicomonadaceae bacterium]
MEHGNASVIAKWIQLIHGLSQTVIIFCMLFGAFATYMAFITLTKLTKQGQMQTMTQASYKEVLIWFIVGVFCFYMSSTITILGETIFHTTSAVTGGDPLSWRSDDTIPVGGSYEDLVMKFIKQSLQFFGLMGVVNGLMSLAAMNNPNVQQKPSFKSVAAYFTAGIGMFYIQDTITLAAEMVPALQGLADSFNV